MHFLRADGLSLAFGDRLMLDEVQIHLQSGTRLALSGPNGSGKTTFLKVLAGKIEADSGRISTSPEARVSYLPQSGIVFSGGSILEQALLAFSDLEKLWEQRQQNAESLKNDPEGGRSGKSFWNGLLSSTMCWKSGPFITGRMSVEKSSPVWVLRLRN
jgi:ATP-binding cassette subfamily F protein 3